MKVLVLVLSLFASSAIAGTCLGPSPTCPDQTVQPTGPAELCLPDGCTPVQYSWFGDFALAGLSQQPYSLE